MLTYDLPETFSLQWNPQMSLKNVVVDFTKVCLFVWNAKQVVLNTPKKALERYQDLWAVLDDIDQHTRVLEPERPTRSCLFRKLALPFPHTFVQITVLPVLARAVPQLRWYGSELVIAPVRDKLSTSLAGW